MDRDGNDGRKGKQENSSNGRSHKHNERRPPTKENKAISKLGLPLASKQTTSLKLKGTLKKKNKVKERLDNWRDGDGALILLDMLVKSISICNKYSL